MSAMQPAAAPSEVMTSAILVVDDHELVRLGLSTLLTSYAHGSGQRVEILEASTLQHALQLYGQHADRIALVLLDLHLPDAHGITGLRSFLARHRHAPVAVLSGSNDPALMRQAMADGARAYLTKSGNLREVIGYVRTLGLLGNGDPGYAPTQPMDFDDEPRCVQPPAGGDAVRLTQRQAQMLDWVLAGQSNREIAERAQLSEGTVKNHVSALLLMFGVRSRSQLISRLR